MLTLRVYISYTLLDSMQMFTNCWNKLLFFYSKIHINTAKLHGIKFLNYIVNGTFYNSRMLIYTLYVKVNRKYDWLHFFLWNPMPTEFAQLWPKKSSQHHAFKISTLWIQYYNIIIILKLSLIKWTAGDPVCWVSSYPCFCLKTTENNDYSSRNWRSGQQQPINMA